MNDLAQAIGPMAWRGFWQVTLVALVVALVVRLCCRRRPHLAHVLWLVVLVKCVTPPVWSSPTGIFSWTQWEAATAPTIAQPPRNELDIEPARDSKALRDNALDQLGLFDLAGTPAVAPPRDIAGADEPGSRFSLSAATVWAGMWLAGAVVYAAIALLVTFGHLRKFRRGETALADRLAPLVADLRRRLGIRRPVRIVVTREVTGPVTFGWLRPTIVMPQALVDGRTADELEPLLAHELIHVRRGDAWIGLLQLIAQCLWWFHPLVWWANRQLAAERERCCDEEVVAGLNCPPVRYARSLLDVLELKEQARWLAGLPGMRSFEITGRRLEYLMRHSARFHARMPRRYWLVLAAGLLVLLPGAGLSGNRGIAAPPKSGAGESSKATAQGSQQISAAQLMQNVYDSQAWVERTPTFRIRAKTTTTWSAEHRRWEQEHPPRLPFFAARRPDSGRPDTRAICYDVDWAWSETGVRKATQSYREGDAEKNKTTWIWDGSLGVEISETPDHLQYVLSDKLETFYNEQTVTNEGGHPWGPRDAHHFWWWPLDVDAYRTSRGFAPEDFELVGREKLNGRDCYVVQCRAVQYRRLHIGVADGRLYQQARMATNPDVPGYDQLAIMRKVGGAKIRSTINWQTWLEGLEPAERNRAQREFQKAKFEFARPYFVQRFDDYREVAPGCWVPFRQTARSFSIEAPESFLASKSEQIVTDVVVNEPLDEDLFRIELKDGGYVATDWRYDPIIRYTYHKDQTEEERQALCEETRKEQEKNAADWKRRHALIEGRMGQMPPPLPQSGWLNGEPLSWEKLRGKVVVLHFWDVNCGPCYNDLPFLVGWHERSNENQIAVIGIHRPTNDFEAVQKKLTEFDAKYPVLIDIPPREEGGLGLLHDWFGNSWWPHAVLVDKAGAVAGHGQLWLGDVAQQMRRLAAEDDQSAH